VTVKAENLRFVAEAIGITAVVLSLVFVGFEIQQTRDMNLAELQHSRLALTHSNMLAVLESEPALEYFGTQIYTPVNGVVWEPENLSETQRAAALVQAEARLIVFEIEHRFIEQGFIVREFSDLEAEISEMVGDEPAIRAVWPLWRYAGDEVNGFFRMMNRILDKPQ
jgi:hypothetical protein